MSIGKITRVALRDVWKHEAADFTTWLENNIDVLNDVLDFNLSSAEREQSAGAFRVDLVGEHEDGGTVVIENQLEKSDHDHLGKVLTYLAALDAKAAVEIRVSTTARAYQGHNVAQRVDVNTVLSCEGRGDPNRRFRASSFTD